MIYSLETLFQYQIYLWGEEIILIERIIKAKEKEYEDNYRSLIQSGESTVGEQNQSINDGWEFYNEGIDIIRLRESIEAFNIILTIL